MMTVSTHANGVIPSMPGYGSSNTDGTRTRSSPCRS
jgi:hypothetical protein